MGWGGGAGRVGKKGWIHTLSHTSYKRLDFVLMCWDFYEHDFAMCLQVCVRTVLSQLWVCFRLCSCVGVHLSTCEVQVFPPQVDDMYLSLLPQQQQAVPLAVGFNEKSIGL